MIITTNQALRERDPHDFYPTPPLLASVALNLLPWNIAAAPHLKELICDIGAGTGVWGDAAKARWPQALIDGCDIRDLPKPQSYDQWVIKDFRELEVRSGTYDASIGNWAYKHAEECLRKSIFSVREGGYVLALLRLAFLESQVRGRGLWRQFQPQSVHVLVSRPSFITEGPKAGKTDETAYAIYIWQKGWTGQPALNWLDWDPEGKPRKKRRETALSQQGT